jgi:alcohol dehydrogenase
MRAVVINEFGMLPTVEDVPDLSAAEDGVLIRVEATGLCRSDWHAWQGHDSDVQLPHVPGHEIAGTISQVGRSVSGWSVGDRVTVPFVCACGSCQQCAAGNQQVCVEQQQPGFTYWGSFAEFVAVPQAEVNLVRLPHELGFEAAASLGCRFATSFRAVTQVGKVARGEWLAVFGCGGVGLSAVMIAAAAGAQVIAVDRNPDALVLAAKHGAVHTVISGTDVADQIRHLTGGGAQVTIDALGAAQIVQSALGSLRPCGRHVQIGLLPDDVTLDMSALVARELQWLGSHGMAAHDYPAMLELVASGAVRPDELVTRVITLEEAPEALIAMNSTSPVGVTVIRPN